MLPISITIPYKYTVPNHHNTSSPVYRSVQRQQQNGGSGQSRHPGLSRGERVGRWVYTACDSVHGQLVMGFGALLVPHAATFIHFFTRSSSFVLTVLPLYNFPQVFLRLPFFSPEVSNQNDSIKVLRRGVHNHDITNKIICSSVNRIP